MSPQWGDVRQLVPPGRWETWEDLDLWRTPEDARVFFHIEADPDDPQVHVDEAWQALLASLPHGSGARFLLLLAPEEDQRRTFLERMAGWPGREHPQRGIWWQELYDFLLHAPLPFERSLILEILLPPRGVDPAFLYGLPGLLVDYGVTARPMSRSEIEALTARFFRPEV